MKTLTKDQEEIINTFFENRCNGTNEYAVLNCEELFDLCKYVVDSDSEIEATLQDVKKLFEDIGTALDFQELSAYKAGKQYIRELKGRVYEMQEKLDNGIFTNVSCSCEQELKQIKDFLTSISSDGSFIVSSNDCSEVEISTERACGRMLIIDSLGFIKRPKIMMRA